MGTWGRCRWLAAAVAASAAVVVLPACEDVDCTPTTMEAEEIAVANLAELQASGVLSAKLTSEGRPLSGKTVDFTIEFNDGDQSAGSSDTAGTGFARVDLKTKPLRLVQGVAAESYDASFTGDGTYCGSTDSAPIDIAAGP